jgi:DNA processing protein
MIHGIEMQRIAEKISSWGQGISELSDSWLVLQTLPGMTPERLHRLIETYDDPIEALRAPNEALARIAGKKAAEALKHETPIDLAHKIRTEAEKNEVQILTRSDEKYPELLKNIYAPPGAIFVKGEIQERDSLGVAIVGMRTPSPYGRRAAQTLARALAERGITIVSGLARGIDTESHQAALEAGGRTLAVLGCGLNINYPSGQEELRNSIVRQGAVISELSWNYPPRPENFPRRNRLISGLSIATVVVEAAQRSGALVTARLALEQGRELMAVPGPIDSGRSVGCHRLLRDGAHLIESVDAILAAFPDYVMEKFSSLSNNSFSTGGKKKSAVRGMTPHLPSSLSPEEKMVFTHFGEDSNTIENMSKKTGLKPEHISHILLNIELRGVLRQTEGGLYEKTL